MRWGQGESDLQSKTEWGDQCPVNSIAEPVDAELALRSPLRRNK